MTILAQLLCAAAVVFSTKMVHTIAAAFCFMIVSFLIWDNSRKESEEISLKPDVEDLVKQHKNKMVKFDLFFAIASVFYLIIAGYSMYHVESIKKQYKNEILKSKGKCIIISEKSTLGESVKKKYNRNYWVVQNFEFLSDWESYGTATKFWLFDGKNKSIDIDIVFFDSIYFVECDDKIL